MSSLDMLSYFAALLAIYIAPGPISLLLIVRTVSHDVQGAIGFALGTAIGSLTILRAMCFGLSIWFESFPAVFAKSKHLILAYLDRIARDIWIGGFDLTGGEHDKRSGFILAVSAGLITCVMSPYMLILFLLVVPEAMDLTPIKMPDFLIISAVTFTADPEAVGIAMLLALQLHRLARSPRALQIMNRALAMLLVSVGGLMALAWAVKRTLGRFTSSNRPAKCWCICLPMM